MNELKINHCGHPLPVIDLGYGDKSGEKL